MFLVTSERQSFAARHRLENGAGPRFVTICATTKGRKLRFARARTDVRHGAMLYAVVQPAK
jgi:hypothetical protein